MTIRHAMDDHTTGAWDGDVPYLYEVGYSDLRPITLDDMTFWTAPRHWEVDAFPEWAFVGETADDDGVTKALNACILGRLGPEDTIWYYVDNVANAILNPRAEVDEDDEEEFELEWWEEDEDEDED